MSHGVISDQIKWPVLWFIELSMMYLEIYHHPEVLFDDHYFFYIHVVAGPMLAVFQQCSCK